MTLPAPVIMGIVNVTPDSFSDGGNFLGAKAAVAHGLRLAEEGAHILDIGGESTRPGADFVPADEEIARVVPVIEGLRAKLDGAVKISIDTRKPAVAEAAVAAGADIWNDVSALTYEEGGVKTAARLGVPVILMHAKGDPETMQNDPRYGDVVAEVRDFLADRIAACAAAGIPKDRIITDPGIGFGKTVAHNVALLQNLGTFRELGCEVLLGASRKRFIAALDRDGEASDRLGGSLATVIAGYWQGVSWFRVHDVAATRQALMVTKALETRS